MSKKAYKDQSPTSILIKTDEYIPEWQNEAEYSFLESKSIDLKKKEIIAWQFLRRNQCYYETFHKRKQLCFEDSNEQHIETDSKNIFVEGIGRSNNPNNDDEVSIELRKWGIGGYVDPSNPTPRYLYFNTQNSYVLNLYNNQKLTQLIPSGYASILINMNYPIKPQIESIKSLLENWQDISSSKVKTSPYFRSDVYIRYIRLLDGLIRSTKPSDIKKILYDGISGDINDKYKKDKKAALDLVNGGYKQLFYVSL